MLLTTLSFDNERLLAKSNHLLLKISGNFKLIIQIITLSIKTIFTAKADYSFKNLIRRIAL